MFALIATLVEFLLILILLFPGSAQDLLMSRVPVEIRPDSDRLGMKLVPAVAVFVFGFAMFRGWDQLLHRAAHDVSDPVWTHLLQAAAVALLGLGISACTIPAQVLRAMAPHFCDRLARPCARVMVIQLVGVTCILVAVQLFRHTVR